MSDKKRDVLPDMDAKTAAMVARFVAAPPVRKRLPPKKVGKKANVGSPLGKAIRLPPDTHDPHALQDAEASHARREAARKQAYKGRTTTGKSE